MSLCMYMKHKQKPCSQALDLMHLMGCYRCVMFLSIAKIICLKQNPVDSDL